MANSLILLYAPRSPFARKVRVVVHELGLDHSIEQVALDPWKDESLRRHNPLCKVPTLILEDGAALYDSSVICQYLNERAGGALFPPVGPARWDALRRQARGDGLTEAVIRRFVEQLGPTTGRSEAVAQRQEAAIAAAIADIDAEPRCDGRFDIGDVATVVALAYLKFRSPEIEWEHHRQRVAAWFERASRRLSVAGTAIR